MDLDDAMYVIEAMRSKFQTTGSDHDKIKVAVMTLQGAVAELKLMRQGKTNGMLSPAMPPRPVPATHPQPQKATPEKTGDEIS
jgi:hypothetical protein